MKKTTLTICFCVCFILTWSQKKNTQGNEGEWMVQGTEKYRQARYEEAASAFSNILTQNDTNRLARYNAGLSFYKAGEKEKASAAFENLIRGKVNDEILFRSLYNKGVLEAEKKNWLNSIGCFREALLMKPNDEDTRYNLEKALEELKKTQKKQEEKNNRPEKKDQAPPKKTPPASKKMMERWLQSLQQKEQEIQRKLQQKNRSVSQPEKDW